ncbi:hypothetical protein [Paraburkholderia eburnea]|uniref:hypothetical protein n=1 Tax=Paraburkholderia eburnea TaxID=1189126 RepID=UPI000CDA8FDA|nr:hypothetical protein [Paraburkholderia eburnea]
MSHELHIKPVQWATSENLEVVDRRCTYLFDCFCEQRNIMALAYLMHAWPLTSTTPEALHNLFEVLGNLRRLHGNLLASEQRGVIDKVLDHLAGA